MTAPEDAMLRAVAPLPGRGTYEAHVTVDLAGHGRERFREACGALGVKAVLIELPVGAGAEQPMTSSYHRGELIDAAAEVAAVARGVRAAGFPVRRVKLEAVAANPGVPDTDPDAGAFPPDCYFEFHFKLLLDPRAELGPAEAVCRQFGARLSLNAFKTRPDGRAERFATLRAFGVGRRTAFARADEFAAALAAAGFPPANTLREYSLFDSDTSLDAGWFDGLGGGDE